MPPAPTYTANTPTSTQKQEALGLLAQFEREQVPRSPDNPWKSHMYLISSHFPFLSSVFSDKFGDKTGCPQGLFTLTANDPISEALAHAALPPISCPLQSPDPGLSIGTGSNFFLLV